MPRDISITRLHNIGIMAHIDASKTSARDQSMSDAYDRVIDCGPTEWRHSIERNLQSHGEAALDLKHLMIDLDDGPCYEFICRAFRVQASTATLPSTERF